MDLVSVAAYANLPEAELAKSRLESEGIQAFVLHENTAGVMPFLTSGENGIHVQVADTDAERARAILTS